MSGDVMDWEGLSVFLEDVTGYDSIPTIERIYDRTPGNAFECAFPGCKFKRRDAQEVWLHIHFGIHRLSFLLDSPVAVTAALDKAGWPEDQAVLEAALAPVRAPPPSSRRVDQRPS